VAKLNVIQITLEVPNLLLPPVGLPGRHYVCDDRIPQR
jgi:hypothetical protein